MKRFLRGLGGPNSELSSLSPLRTHSIHSNLALADRPSGRLPIGRSDLLTQNPIGRSTRVISEWSERFLNGLGGLN